MKAYDEYRKYRKIADDLDAHWEDQASPEFGAAVGKLRKTAEGGCVEAAAALAEILALPWPRHDAAEAYRWCFVWYSTEGNETRFENISHGPWYCGPVGDFRNEPMVTGLVQDLGLERTRELDSEVSQWLETHSMRFTDPRDHRTKK